MFTNAGSASPSYVVSRPLDRSLAQRVVCTRNGFTDAIGHRMSRWKNAWLPADSYFYSWRAEARTFFSQRLLHMVKTQIGQMWTCGILRLHTNPGSHRGFVRTPDGWIFPTMVRAGQRLVVTRYIRQPYRQGYSSLTPRGPRMS